LKAVIEMIVIWYLVFGACVLGALYALHQSLWYATYEKRGGRLLPIGSQVFWAIWWVLLAGGGIAGAVLVAPFA
jgi:hypothetical protein